jgi:NADH dehydrogenase/NADH:ubiquinone oxidoreductase subunit G
MPDMIIKEAPGTSEDVPTLMMHEGVNDTGLLKLGLKGYPRSKAYLHVGNLKGKLPGFTIVLGFSEEADIMLPHECFAEKDGTVINSAGREIRFKGARGNDNNIMEKLFAE